MKNMFDGKTNEDALKACMEAVDAFADSIIMKQLAKDKGVIPDMNFDSNEAIQFSIMNDAIDKIANKSRANTYKDIITRIFGLFDSEMTELNAKKSELLRKDHVKNYRYKHHLWHAGWYVSEYNNIIHLIGYVLGLTRVVVDKSARNTSAKYMKEIADQEYKAKIDGYIETRLAGWGKGAYDKYLRAYMLGDGTKEVVREFNFQDDWSISDMLRWEQNMTKDALDQCKKLDIARVKDINEQIKDFIKKYHEYAKADKANAKIYAAEIKRCVKYTSFLVGRLDEFFSATYYAFNTERNEIHAVLKGLLDYQGD